MSVTLRPEQVDWVKRVLGLDIAASGSAAGSPDDFKARWQTSFGTWRDAIETVDGQMAALGSACRQTDDPWLANIAELGLPAVTANMKTPLMAACMDVANASGDKLPAAAARARAAIANFANHIATDPQVAGCDANPFGVAVDIRGTLGPALKSLEAALPRA